MLTRHTLRTFPTAALACAAIDALYRDYKAVHKRGAPAILFYSLTATPDPTAEKAYLTIDTHAITIHADLPAQAAELAWFTQSASSL